MKRHARQTRLREVGAEGQAKIAAAKVSCASGFAGWVEARYLRAAGVGEVAPGTVEARDARFDDLDPAAREVALGAHAAVAALREILALR
jgi:hypothetical protein